ncbi:carbohydrate kinase family protein [Candidatus Xianfuyuplasma coldseepsis]|uniref:Carbohydrate kinase n=1 Tax=Candidatus Xianfuyuplasma coldseepsis TaxID=2782163 RepID=A0A7L7KQJ3_9MOLU|nr:carbohydrate kinase [Xianfuyuplasma coldseepsis]QMS85080.1 carbohydrate kinase [Xianfuyuplasma coldseepsis]
MNKLISIGELLIDFIPKEKGRKLKDVVNYERVAGGAPANVAACVTRLGGSAIMLTKVGKDGFGDHLIESLNAVGVDTSHIKRTDKANTALAFVSLTNDGERDFSFYRNPSADMLLEPKDIDESIFKKGDVLHFCSVDLVDYPVRKAHKAAIEYAQKHDMIISFDPNLRFPLWPDKDAYKKTINQFIPEAHILKISDDELLFITGIENKSDAIQSLFKGNVRVIILTEGSNGASIYTKQNVIFVPSEKVKPVDTTGAGDSFIGAIIYQLLARGINLNNLEDVQDEAILSFAHKVSQHVVLEKGAIPVMPTKQDLRK